MGLRRGAVALEPYRAAWHESFIQERRALKVIFGAEAVAIEHIGSTAVPGLIAKPIVDIEVGLRDFASWRRFIGPLEKAGYVFMPERIRTDEIFLPKGPEEDRTHYLHVTQFASSEWQKVILFRDALRCDAAMRDEYAELKKTLALQFSDDRQAYSHGKMEFILNSIKGRGDERRIRDDAID